MPDFDCNRNFRFFTLVSLWSFHLCFIVVVLVGFFASEPEWKQRWWNLFCEGPKLCCSLIDDGLSDLPSGLRLRGLHSGNSNSSSRSQSRPNWKNKRRRNTGGGSGGGSSMNDLSFTDRLKNAYDRWRMVLALSTVSFMMITLINVLLFGFYYRRTVGLLLFYASSLTVCSLVLSLFFVSLIQVVLSFHGSSFEISNHVIKRYYAGLIWILCSVLFYFVFTPSVLGDFIPLWLLDGVQALLSGSALITGLGMFVLITYQFSVRLISLVSINHRHQKQRPTLSSRPSRCLSNPISSGLTASSRSPKAGIPRHTDTGISLKCSLEVRSDGAITNDAISSPGPTTILVSDNHDDGDLRHQQSPVNPRVVHPSRPSLELGAGSSESSEHSSDSRSSTDIGGDLSTTNETLETTTQGREMTEQGDRDPPLKAAEMRRTRSVIEEFGPGEQAFLRTVARQLVLSLWFSLSLLLLLITAVSWSFTFNCWTPMYTGTFWCCGFGFCILILCRFYFGEPSKTEEYEYYCGLCDGFVLDLAAMVASRESDR